MFGHDDIGNQAEVKLLADTIYGISHNSAKPLIGQDRDSPMGTEGDESGPAIMIEMPKFHGIRKIAGWLARSS